MVNIESVKRILINENGYIEKKKGTPSNKLYDKSNEYDGADNYIYEWYDAVKKYGLQNFQGSYWCCGAPFIVLANNLGIKTARELMGNQHFPINCQSTYNAFKSKGRVFDTPKVGDWVVFWGGNRFNHIEFVTVVTATTFTTVGFNTTANSTTISRNGGGVKYPKKYSISAAKKSGHKFLRPEYGEQIQTGWIKKDEKWQYALDDGTIVKGKWEYIKDRWYVFDEAGYMITGWYLDSNNQWYYMNGDGTLSQQNWVKTDNKWYYTNPDGTLHKGWLQDGSDWYLLNEDGEMQIGWQEVDGKWYVFLDSGKMLHDTWFKSLDDWYYLSSTGAMKTSQWIQQDDGKFYYVKEDGKMATYAYIKDEYKNVYYWVNEDGVYENKYDTSEPDLNKYKLVK